MIGAKLYVPIEDTGKVNVIQVRVDHQEDWSRGVQLTFSAWKIETSPGGLTSIGFSIGDPVHKRKTIVLESLKRLDRKKLAAWSSQVETDINCRSGPAWNDLLNFAQGMGFKVLPQNIPASL